MIIFVLGSFTMMFFFFKNTFFSAVKTNRCSRLAKDRFSVGSLVEALFELMIIFKSSDPRPQKCRYFKIVPNETKIDGRVFFVGVSLHVFYAFRTDIKNGKLSTHACEQSRKIVCFDE